MELGVFESLGVALGLGLIVGLQRQWRVHHLGGIRTFPLITLFGATSGLLSEPYGQGILIAGLITLAAVLAIGNLVAIKSAIDVGPGVTTEIAALLMFVVGAIVAAGDLAVAIVVAGVVGVLLQWKKPLHELVAQIDAEDLRAIFQLVVVALVILPVLPDAQLGPYEALNPQRIWLMVALIVGISLGAYFVYRFIGLEAGVVIGGVLGGMISSTATTFSYSRQSARTPDGPIVFATAIVLASAVVYARVAAELGVVAPQLLRAAWLPLSVMLVGSTLCGFVLFLSSRRTTIQPPRLENPANVRSAVIFGGLYALILLAVAAVDASFGNSAIYGVAMISGLTDVDALTLSVADLFARGQLADSTAWRAVITASLSNLFVKGIIVGLVASRAVLKPVAIAFTAIFLIGLAVLLGWPT